MCDPAGADEDKVIAVTVTTEMTREDVVQKALVMLLSRLAAIVQLGPSQRVNPKSWFGPKRNTKFDFNTTHHHHPPPTKTFSALPGIQVS